MQTQFTTDWKGSLSRSGQDASENAASYPEERTIQGCWDALDTLFETEQICKNTYEEIKSKVTFEVWED